MPNRFSIRHGTKGTVVYGCSTLTLNRVDKLRMIGYLTLALLHPWTEFRFEHNGGIALLGMRVTRTQCGPSPLPGYDFAEDSD